MSIEKAKEVIRLEAESIRVLEDRIGEDFQKAIDIIFNCKGKVIVTGVGKSGIIGKKIAATLSSTGTPSVFLNPGDSVHGDLGIVSGDDVVICLSKSGESEEFRVFISVIKRMNIPVISLLGKQDSFLAKNSDIIIDVSVKEEACSLDLAPTSSTTASLAMGDAIAVALLDKRDFTKEDFAFLHPGGNIGKRLLLKVKDIMYTGSYIPKVNKDSTFKEIVVEMNAKRFGSTCVVKKDGVLCGIITDGDLKRTLEKYEDLHSLKASNMMSKKPKTVKEDDLAIVALNTMKQFDIMQLVVVDDNMLIAGMIHLHDILESGLS